MAGNSINVKMVPIDLNKVVIVVGGTGTGKSTIINMLYNGDVSKDCCKKPCTVNYTRDSVTKKPQWIFNCKEGLVTGDTVGFGDPSMSDVQVARELKKFIAILRNGVHGIILVTKFGRMTKEEQSTIKALIGIFGKRCYQHMILVVTHYDGEDCEDYATKQRIINTWVGNDSYMKDFLKNIEDRVIFTDNNVNVDRYEAASRSLRQQCLDNLMLFIRFRCDELLRSTMPPRLMWERILIPLLSGIRLRSGEIISEYESSTIKIGECSICMDEIDLSTLAFTECHHYFHKSCIEQSIVATDAACPECRQHIAVICTPEISVIPPSENSRPTNAADGQVFYRKKSGSMCTLI